MVIVEDKRKENKTRREEQPEKAEELQEFDCWVSDMKSDMEEYIEEQGIYIRQ